MSDGLYAPLDQPAARRLAVEAIVACANDDYLDGWSVAHDIDELGIAAIAPFAAEVLALAAMAIGYVANTEDVSADTALFRIVSSQQHPS
jgi:hypothetical protein